jgi:hypothetical protein
VLRSRRICDWIIRAPRLFSRNGKLKMENAAEKLANQFKNSVELDHLTELQLKMVEEILLNKFGKKIK